MTNDHEQPRDPQSGPPAYNSGGDQGGLPHYSAPQNDGQNDGQYGAPQAGGQYGAPQYGAPQYGGAPGYGPNQYSGGQPPIWAPWYGIPFPKAFTRFWKKYATFSGRASRSEFLWWVLWSVIITLVLSIIVGLIAFATGDYTTSSQVSSSGASVSEQSNSPVGTALLGIWYLAILVPSIAVQVRRLHDVNLSGLLVLLNLIPILGQIAVLIMMILPSNPAGQRFDRPRS